MTSSPLQAKRPIPPYLREVRCGGVPVNQPGGLVLVPVRLDAFAYQGIIPAVCAYLVDFDEAPQGFFQALGQAFGKHLRLLMPTARCPTLLMVVPYRPYPNSAGQLIGLLRNHGFVMQPMTYRPGQYPLTPLSREQ